MRIRLLAAMAALLAVAAVLYFVFGRSEPEPEPEVEIVPPLWDVEMLDLVRVSIELPQSGQSEAWEKRADKQWYFLQPDGDGPQVDRKRWGGGIPLILSGPRGNRRIAPDASDEQIEIYGLNKPAMKIVLNSADRRFDVAVGDATPDGQSYYIKLADSADVYSIDYTWFDVLERLVVEPPYAE